MHGCCFEEMVADLVEVSNGPDDVRANVAFSVEVLESPPDVYVFSFLGYGSRSFGGNVVVDPLLDFYYAGAVVDFEGGVGGLGGDLEDLTDD